MEILHDELRDLEQRVSEEITALGKKHRVQSIKGEVLSNTGLVRGVTEEEEFYGLINARLHLTAEV